MDDVRLLIEAMHGEMRREFAELRAVMATKRDLEEMRAEMRDENRSQHAATRRELHVVAEDLANRISEVAKALQMLDEKVDRNLVRLDDKMDRGFAETVRLIQWSHSNLDMRLSALE